MADPKLEKDVAAYIDEHFQKTIVEPLTEFIRIPNQSRAFDAEWETNGLMDKACHFVMDWAKTLEIEGLTMELIKEPGRTNAILAIVDKKDAPTVLMYGHIDKQPPLTEKWREGLHPYKPVLENGRLYGRGGADDGYAFFASLFIAKTLQKFGLQKHRFVFFFECDEESSSKDLVYYLNEKSKAIGDIAIMVCLDSGAVDYEHLSLTTSLRGVANFSLKVEVVKEGLHSGGASGVVPDTFRIARHLLNQFEDSATGRLIPELYVNIPKDKYTQAVDLINEIKNFDFKIPFVQGAKPMSDDNLQQYLGKTWMPTCTIIGFEGLPPPGKCGNVLNPSTTYVVSCRLPPTLPHEKAIESIKAFFANVKAPYGAKVTVDNFVGGTGLNVNAYSAHLTNVINEAALAHFGKIPLYMGEGGSIPFLNSLQKKFEKAEFLVAGVLGPESNAHGPNEFIDIKFLQKLIHSFVHIFRKV